jgi:hypothetical protein
MATKVFQSKWIVPIEKMSRGGIPFPNITQKPRVSAFLLSLFSFFKGPQPLFEQLQCPSG